MCGVFSLTLTLSRWERENPPPPFSKTYGGIFRTIIRKTTIAHHCCSLSQGERVRERENGAFQIDALTV